MFTIDFTKPFLYKDIIYFNQGNLAANNILRCKLVTGGDETLEGYIATVTFKTLSHAEINESVNIVDAKNCIVDIKFPSNALEVGVNELEVILIKGDGADKVVTPSPIIKYEVWQCITTGNGIQGDSNYPILIDLISEVNNAVRIANNASATADASLKQTAKMLEVVDDNIAKANEAIDNTNSAKDEALNAVEEVNSVKGNLISEVNAAKNSMVEDINSTKNTVVADVNQAKNDMKITVDEAIKFLKQEFNSLTAQQQEELELLQARDGEVNLNTRLERDLAKGKIIYETVEGSYISADDTLDSYIQNIEIKGNTIQNPSDLSDIKSTGDKVGDEELYKIPIVCCGANINSTNLIRGNCNTNTGVNESGGMTILITSDFLKVPENTTFSYDTNGIKIRNIITFSYDTDKKYIGYENTIKSKPGAKFIKVRFTKYDRTEFTDKEVSDIRLSINVGEQSIPYEDYKEHKITILSPCQLEKVGDVEDRIIEKDGVWGVEENTVLINFKDLKNIAIRNIPNNTKTISVMGDYDVDVNYRGADIISNIYAEHSFSDTEHVWFDTGLRKWSVNISKERVSSFEDAKNYLATGAVYVIAKRKEPQFIQLPHSQQVKLKTFANKTNISFECEIEGTIKADVAKSISASVNSNTQEISDLWDFVLKNNLANFAVALNALDTKLRLEQLTKTPR